MKTTTNQKAGKLRVTRSFASAFPKDIAKKVNLKIGHVFTVTTQGKKIVLTPTVDQTKAEIDAAIAVGLKDVEEGRMSPAFDDIEDAITWLRSNKV